MGHWKFNRRTLMLNEGGRFVNFTWQFGSGFLYLYVAGRLFIRKGRK